MRKTVSFAAAALVAMAALAAPAHAGENHDTTPRHGGIVAVANDIDFELVARPDVITLHVRDHGKVVPTAGATARLTLLAGTEKSEVALAPAAGDTLQARGSFKVGPGTRIVAAVGLPGRKPANVRFALK